MRLEASSLLSPPATPLLQPPSPPSLALNDVLHVENFPKFPSSSKWEMHAPLFLYGRRVEEKKNSYTTAPFALVAGSMSFLKGLGLPSEIYFNY